jgi:hypothetical protein
MTASMDGRSHLNCPRCGLSIEVRPNRAAITHCPRCVGRSRVAVELFSSSLPTDLLYREGSSPSADEEPASSCRVAAAGNLRLLIHSGGELASFAG